MTFYSISSTNKTSFYYPIFSGGVHSSYSLRDKSQAVYLSWLFGTEDGAERLLQAGPYHFFSNGAFQGTRAWLATACRLPQVPCLSLVDTQGWNTAAPRSNRELLKMCMVYALRSWLEEDIDVDRTCNLNDGFKFLHAFITAALCHHYVSLSPLARLHGKKSWMDELEWVALGQQVFLAWFKTRIADQRSSEWS
jgi:hypothetical protein